ncbi:MAG: HoxN/HupN/NixA family nickel/cobalt transporter [Acidimicrobiales bacterium]
MSSQITGATRAGAISAKAPRSALTGAERVRLGSIGLVVLGLNALGWGIFVFAIAPHRFEFRGLGLGLGVALTAWTLGARHAFDADHISAIDNTTRKLMADGGRPLGTGFFFALGHSSIIMAVGVGLSVAARAVFGAVVNPHSGYETLGGVIGTSMAATFLYLIAALNLVVLAGILKVFRGMRQGLYDEEELERQLQSRGLMYRFFGRWMRSITKTWHMYFVGIVFGIGFDTATEVLLLAATAAAATQGLPWYAVLSLPLLFSGGMTLFDSLDGCFMNFAYGWAFARPVRKVYYNLVITGLSIGVAFLVGTIEIFGVLSAELHIHGGFWDFVANFNINKAGFAIVGLFVAVWVVALGYWKLGGVEARWAGQAVVGEVAEGGSAFLVDSRGFPKARSGDLELPLNGSTFGGLSGFGKAGGAGSRPDSARSDQPRGIAKSSSRSARRTGRRRHDPGRINENDCSPLQRHCRTVCHRAVCCCGCLGLNVAQAWT